MMTLFDLKKGDTATVVQIDADTELRDRLFSFGVRSGAVLSVQEVSLTRQTVKAKVGASMIALRRSEARSIMVIAS